MEKSEIRLGYKTMFQHGTAVNEPRHGSLPKPAGRASREHLSEKQPVDTQEQHIVSAQVGESIDATTSWKSDPEKSITLECFKITTPSWSKRHTFHTWIGHRRGLTLIQSRVFVMFWRRLCTVVGLRCHQYKFFLKT